MKKGFIGIPVLIAILLGIVVIGGGVYFALHQKTPLQSQTQTTSTVSNSQNTAVPVITITNINGRTVTVQYSGLSVTEEGTTSPTVLSVQNEGWGKPTLEVPMDGKPSGEITFTLPTNAPDGNYTVIPAGIPTEPYVGGVGPGYVSYGKTNAIVLASFYLSPSGSITIGTESASVPGMNKYIDTDFGFSFWYPSAWIVSAQSSTIVIQEQSGQYPRKITIAKAYRSDGILDASGACGSCVSVKYYFDAAKRAWMRIYDPVGNGGTTSEADVSKNTMGGLHIFADCSRFGGSVIPLTAKNFLLINGDNGGSGYYFDLPLSRTVLAADPDVATPISADEQIKTIQAEADAYK